MGVILPPMGEYARKGAEFKLCGRYRYAVHGESCTLGVLRVVPRLRRTQLIHRYPSLGGRHGASPGRPSAFLFPASRVRFSAGSRRRAAGFHRTARISWNLPTERVVVSVRYADRNYHREFVSWPKPLFASSPFSASSPSQPARPRISVARASAPVAAIWQTARSVATGWSARQWVPQQAPSATTSRRNTVTDHQIGAGFGAETVEFMQAIGATGTGGFFVAGDAGAPRGLKNM